MAAMYMDVDVALAEVPVNVLALTDDTDFKSLETTVAFNAAGMDLVWHFVTTAGVYTQTPVTPSNSGNYLWTNRGRGYYAIQIPASGGATINNDREGCGWFAGKANGVLAWRGPLITFRAAPLNDALIDGGDLLDVNVTQWLGFAVQADSNGHPRVTIKVGSGTGELGIVNGRVQIQSGYQRGAAIAAFPFVMINATTRQPMPGLSPTVVRKIDGGAFAGGTITNVQDAANGLYTCDLGTGDTNGGKVTYLFTADGAEPLLITVFFDP